MKHTIKYILAFNAFVFVALIMLTLPINIYAGPPVRCPCFTLRQVERTLMKSTAPIICEDDGVDYIAVNDEALVHFAYAYATGWDDSGDYYCCDGVKYNVWNNHERWIHDETLTEDEYDFCVDVLVQACASLLP